MTSSTKPRPKINFPITGKIEAFTSLPVRMTIVDGRGVHEIVAVDQSVDETPAIIWRRRGKDDVPLLTGTSEEVAEAFDELSRSIGAVFDTPEAAPAKKRSYLPIAATVAAIVAAGGLNAGVLAYLLRDRPPAVVDDARLTAIEQVAKQLQGFGMPDAMAQRGPQGANPATVPTGLPSLQQAPGLPVTAESPAAKAGAVVVPKELPPLPVQPAADKTAEPPKARVPVTDSVSAAKAPAEASIAIDPDAEEVALAPTKQPAGTEKADPKPEAKVAEKPADKATETPEAGKDGASKKDPLREMSATEAQDLLRQLEEIKTKTADGSELPLELLRKLPAEVAARLVGTGIATVSPQERKQRAERQARIVRLPASIINKYRDRTGIASIPEADSWVANGGRISIPLPGGGDITSPDIMTQFGLKP